MGIEEPRARVIHELCIVYYTCRVLDCVQQNPQRCLVPDIIEFTLTFSKTLLNNGHLMRRFSNKLQSHALF